jgi:hypothetical protein
MNRRARKYCKPNLALGAGVGQRRSIGRLRDGGSGCTWKGSGEFTRLSEVPSLAGRKSGLQLSSGLSQRLFACATARPPLTTALCCVDTKPLDMTLRAWSISNDRERQSARSRVAALFPFPERSRAHRSVPP